MPSISYTRDTPNAPNDPADDQPRMKQNTNSIDNIIGVDHFSFTDSNAGYHNVVHLVHQNPDVNPPTIGGVASLYARSISSVGSTDEVLFYKTGGGRVFQMTVNAIPVASNNGYSFLPGGILVQWGEITQGGGLLTTGTVTFSSSNISFPNACFNVSVTVKGNSSSTQLLQVVNKSKTDFNWKFTTNANPSYTGFLWTAIGN